MMNLDETRNRVVFYTDDDQDDLDTFKDVMSEIDSDAVLFTHDHADKLMYALENPPPIPHLVFLDLNMPGKNGFEVLKELRNSADFSNLPIVVLSTSDDATSIDNSMRLGANYYIPKANDYMKLKASVNHALNIDWSTFKPNASNFVYKN